MFSANERRGRSTLEEHTTLLVSLGRPCPLQQQAWTRIRHRMSLGFLSWRLALLHRGIVIECGANMVIAHGTRCIAEDGILRKTTRPLQSYASSYIFFVRRLRVSQRVICKLTTFRSTEPVHQ